MGRGDYDYGGGDYGGGDYGDGDYGDGDYGDGGYGDYGGSRRVTGSRSSKPVQVNDFNEYRSKPGGSLIVFGVV